jgi:hypothetical protein
MKGEIDKDFYCSAGDRRIGRECDFTVNDFPRRCTPDCPCYHRKHPTLEQFKEEYDEEYPDDGAVYYRDHNKFVRTEYKDDGSFENIYAYTEWRATLYLEFKRYLGRYDKKVWGRFEVVCACTPWSCPPADWRPE